MTKPPLQYTLKHVFVAVTLISAFFAFIAWAGFIGAFVFGVASSVALLCLAFFKRDRGYAVGGLLILFSVILLVVGAPDGARISTRRSFCKNTLKQIGLGLLAYESECGSYPPAFIADGDGTPMHSWRTLLTPYIELNDIYEAYDFNEPWNGLTNGPLAQDMPWAYACPRDYRPAVATTTSYVAVTGRGFVFDGSKAVRLPDIIDGSSNTIALIELADSGIQWTEPRDITYEEFVQRFQKRTVSNHHGGFNVVFADCSVVFIDYDSLDVETLRAMFTIAGGEMVWLPK